jgi:epoxide hydrolase-like predicted phosphatase
MPIKAIIFDRDNTLLRLDPAGIARFEERVHTIAPQLPPRAAVQHWMQWSNGWPRTSADEDRFWLHFWSSLGEKHAVQPAQIEQLQELGAFYHTVFVAFPDTMPCLSQLHTRGVPIAILTNFDLPSVDRTLRNADIDPTWFQVLCSSAELGVRKPDPQAYTIVAQRLGVHVSDCLFVDDLIENVEAACQLGMRGILLDRQGKYPNYTGTHIQNLDTISTFI